LYTFDHSGGLHTWSHHKSHFYPLDPGQSSTRSVHLCFLSCTNTVKAVVKLYTFNYTAIIKLSPTCSLFFFTTFLIDTYMRFGPITFEIYMLIIEFKDQRYNVLVNTFKVQK
ncbi:hypothetical protein L9F63_020290, partial [Diploptera punctata]